MHISRITIGRLYNLGNYEHVRYELSADLQHGESAEDATVRLLKILRAVNPKPPVSTYEYNRAATFLEDPEPWLKQYRDPEERARELERQHKESTEKVALYVAWQKRREAALAALNHFGGSEEHKDAKLDWSPWDDFDD